MDVPPEYQGDVSELKKITQNAPFTVQFLCIKAIGKVQEDKLTIAAFPSMTSPSLFHNQVQTSFSLRFKKMSPWGQSLRGLILCAAKQASSNSNQ